MPVLALCQALRSQNKSAEIFFIGTGDSAEQELVTAQGLKYYSVPSGKFRRYGRGVVTELTDIKTIRANVRDAGRYINGRRRARAILRELNPDVVFTKGSNPSVPVGQAASQLGIPLVIHESDSIMGLANRVLARKASAIATGFPIQHFDRLKTKATLTYTGSPIREALEEGDASRADKHFKLEPKRPVLLVIGGSQGALPINKIIWESLDMLTQHVQIIHQAGSHSIDEALKYARPRYFPVERLGDELADVYERSDIVISRAGATTLAELAHFRKPAILIPWPGAANDHQVANAAYFSHKGAARVIEQDHLTPATLVEAVESLLKHPNDRMHLGEAIGRLAKPDAAGELARLVIKTGKHHA